MDRDKVTKPTAQIGFLKFVLIPMFETVTKVKSPKARKHRGGEQSFSVCPTRCLVIQGNGDVPSTPHLSPPFQHLQFNNAAS